MNAEKVVYGSIDEYIASFSPEVQTRLEQVRREIQLALPDAQEIISYNMPAFGLHGGAVVHFAAYKKHIGIYPAPSGDEAFNSRLAPYLSGKSTVQFPFDQPLPLDLIRTIAILHAAEQAKRTAAKAAKAKK